jgi:RNA polymerase sigma factor (TIGR02999 family)
LLRAWSGGDEAALGRLAERVYPELRLMARRYMKSSGPGNIIQGTALVHEVYLRLVDVTQVELRERAQFFAMAAQIMRRILVDAARARGALKRGGNAVRVNTNRSWYPASRSDPLSHWMMPLPPYRSLPRDRRKSLNCVISAD